MPQNISTENRSGKTVRITPKVNCWRMVWYDTTVFALFSSSGKTETIQNMFAGTRGECQQQANSLNLTIPNRLQGPA